MNRPLLLAGAAALLLNGCTYLGEKDWLPTVSANSEPAPPPNPTTEGALQIDVVLDELFVGGFALQGKVDQAVIPTGPRQVIGSTLEQRTADYIRVDKYLEESESADSTVVADFEFWKAERIGRPAIDRSDIEQAQNMLASLGYYDGPVDGLYGPKTEQAIRAFEKDRNLPADGRVTPKLLQALAVNL